MQEEDLRISGYSGRFRTDLENRMEDENIVDVAVISGSKSDQAIVDRILQRLQERGASYEHRVLSAHRNPEELEKYIAGTDARVFIGIAGLSAALPGVIASRTTRPVK